LKPTVAERFRLLSLTRNFEVLPTGTWQLKSRGLRAPLSTQPSTPWVPSTSMAWLGSDDLDATLADRAWLRGKLQLANIESFIEVMIRAQMRDDPVLAQLDFHRIRTS
jgi:hypothetical protein